LNDEAASVQHRRRLNLERARSQNLQASNQNRNKDSSTEDTIPMTHNKRENPPLFQPAQLVSTRNFFASLRSEIRPAYPHLAAL
jgi:hypothetical protein